MINQTRLTLEAHLESIHLRIGQVVKVVKLVEMMLEQNDFELRSLLAKSE